MVSDGRKFGGYHSASTWGTVRWSSSTSRNRTPSVKCSLIAWDTAKPFVFPIIRVKQSRHLLRIVRTVLVTVNKRYNFIATAKQLAGKINIEYRSYLLLLLPVNQLATLTFLGPDALFEFRVVSNIWEIFNRNFGSILSPHRQQLRINDETRAVSKGYWSRILNYRAV